MKNLWPKQFFQNYIKNKDAVELLTVKNDIKLDKTDPKAAVDRVDPLCIDYSEQNKTKRWRFACFCNCLSIASINIEVNFFIQRVLKDIFSRVSTFSRIGSFHSIIIKLILPINSILIFSCLFASLSNRAVLLLVYNYFRGLGAFVQFL